MIPNDTVFDELRTIALKQQIQDEDLAFSLAAYMLGFETYTGFQNKA